MNTKPALLGLILFSSTVNADGYYGINYTRVGLPVADPTAIELKWGVQSEVTAFEVRAGRPVSDDSSSIFGTSIDYEVEYVGVLARMGAFNERGGVYGLVGIMDMTITLSTNELSDTHSENDLVFGIGAEFTANGLAVEYMNGTRDLEEISWLSVGYFKRY